MATTGPAAREVSNSSDITTAVLLLAVGLAVSQLAARVRRLEVVAVTDAGYLARIREAAVVARSRPAPAVVDHVRAELVGLLGLRGCRFEHGSLLGHPPRLEQDASIVVGRRQRATNALGMPDDELELRAFAGGRYVGRFMLDAVPGSRPGRQALVVAVTLAGPGRCRAGVVQPAGEGGLTRGRDRAPGGSAGAEGGFLAVEVVLQAAAGGVADAVFVVEAVQFGVLDGDDLWPVPGTGRGCRGGQGPEDGAAVAGTEATAVGRALAGGSCGSLHGARARMA
ncbi:hypothetical protein P3T27_005069 [Kitasatospora sp. MAA19]|uniref:hypothetical protein n=1 Tax=Kitasatospora sp. MAA19 TaxID=3035090 RepID=UPI0024750904|nr:hypothetical protein [Kitasatospora sp. MAA19]MDH6708330.1 hypothetical protein [Kitasatospora sp. MAA19]